MSWETAPTNAAVVVGTAVTTRQIIDWVTTASTKKILLFVFNSHARTATAIRNSVSFTEIANAIYLGVGRVTVLQIPNPGAGTHNIDVTFSGTTNPAVVAANVENITDNILDFYIDSDDANGQPSLNTLDPTVPGAFLVSAILRGGALALTFNTTGGGVEDVDMAAATGQIGIGSRVAVGTTEDMDWGIIASGAFSTVGVAFEPDTGGGETNIDPELIASTVSFFEPSTAQAAHPATVIAAGGYRDHAASTANADLLSAINEPGRNDTTFIESPESPSDATFEATLSELLSADGYRVRYTYGKDEAAGQQINQTVQLRSPDGTTLVREWVHTDVGVFPQVAEQDISDLTVNGEHRIRLISDAV